MNNNRCVMCGKIIPESLQVCGDCQTKNFFGNNGNNGNNTFDLLSLISLIIGMKNLQENREQTAYNDVQSANNNQAKFLLQELGKKFDEQNEMLKRIIELLEEQKNEIKKD